MTVDIVVWSWFRFKPDIYKSLGRHDTSGSRIIRKELCTPQLQNASTAIWIRELSAVFSMTSTNCSRTLQNHGMSVQMASHNRTFLISNLVAFILAHVNHHLAFVGYLQFSGVTSKHPKH